MDFQMIEISASTNRLVLRGRMDSAGADRLELPVTAALRDASRAVVVDLSAVPFMGSLGIRVLIGAARVLQRRGFGMVLYGAQPPVLDVFETIALAELIPIAASETEALALLA